MHLLILVLLSLLNFENRTVISAVSDVTIKRGGQMRLFSKCLIFFIFVGLAIVVGVNADIPPTPETFTHTTGNFWVNYTWEANPSGNIADSYNVSINGDWTNK
ncbi:MAG: hypothetical protein HF974_03225, partial [ANME-2 cluster archaeon]|nr:hypothetical protein [ANME-2 cluster archaeon]